MSLLPPPMRTPVLDASNGFTAPWYRWFQALLSTANAVESAAMGAWTALSYSSTITIDHMDGTKQAVTLTGNVTFAAPTNFSDGDELYLLIAQDGTGNRTVTWNSAWAWATGMGEIDGAANAVTTIHFIWRGTTPRVISKSQGAQ